MEFKKLKYNRYIVLFMIIFLISFSSAFVILCKADGVNNFSMDRPISNYLSVGDYFEAPEGKFGDKKAHSIIYDSYGNEVGKNNITFKTHGYYKLKYLCSINGENKEHVEKFYVSNLPYYFSGVNSNAHYENNNELTQRAGLVVDIAPQETFYYNNIVDMSKYDEKKPAFCLTVCPQTPGMYDAERVNIALVDVENENNKVDIMLNFTRPQDDAGGCWVECRARANSQNYKALDNSAGGKLQINSYGTYFNMYSKDVFTFKNTTGIFANQYIGFWVEPNTNKLYMNFYHFFAHGPSSSVVIDLDDNSYQESMFEGFKSNNVKIQINCEGYRNKFERLQILYMGDNKLDDLVIIDKDAPIITEDFNIDDLPKAKKGYSYPILPVKANDDICGEVPTTAKVFYDNKEIPVENNRFKTNNIGDYTIYYEAKDYDGNIGKHEVVINASEIQSSVEKPILEEDYLTQYEVNNKIKLPKVKDVTNDPYGIHYLYRVTKDDNEIDLIGNSVSGYYFLPSDIGKYNVEIKAMDFVGNSNSISYNIDIVDNGNMPFISEPALPTCFYTKTNYILPSYKGINANGEVEYASIIIKDGSGDRRYQKDSEIQFMPDNKGSAEVTYFFGTNTRSYTIPVIESGSSLVTKYFYSENANIYADSIGVKMFNDKDYDVEFKNPLLADGFKTEIRLSPVYKIGTEFAVTLTDFIDNSQTVEIKLIFNGQSFDLMIGKERIINNFIASKEGKPILLTLGYDYDHQGWTLGTSNRYTVRKTKYDSNFNNFISGKIYVKYSLKNVQNESLFYVTNLVNQPLNSSIVSDNILPELRINGTIKEILVEPKTIIDLYSASACDVFSPYVKTTLTMTDVNGNIVVANDGTKLDNVYCNDLSFKVELNDYGTYYITYQAIDTSNNVKTQQYMYKVEDFIAPEIINCSIDKTAKLNDFISIPNFEVQDNRSTEIVTYVTVMTPDNDIVYIKKEDKKFKVDKMGTYTIFINAMDEIGNCSVKEFTVNVN